MKHIVFIDVDGTLLDDDHSIREKTIKACIEARKQGHLLFLCTGRSKAELYQNILDIGFDGLICAGGGYVEINGNVLFHKQVCLEEVRHVVDYFKAHNIDYYLESNGGLYGSEGCLAHVMRVSNIAKKEDHPFTNVLITGEDMYRNDINKVCFLQPSIPFKDIEKEFAQAFEVLQCTIPMFGEDSGELAVKGVNKRTAIKEVLQQLNFSQSQTIAIGDGMNDIEMLSYCAIGIAMGNAKDGLKQIADHVTEDIQDDGFYKAFQRYHLI